MCHGSHLLDALPLRTFVLNANAPHVVKAIGTVKPAKNVHVAAIDHASMSRAWGLEGEKPDLNEVARCRTAADVQVACLHFACL